MIHHCLRNFGFDCFLLGNLTGSQTGLKGFLGFAVLTSKKTYSPVCRPVSSNKTSKSKSPGLYFTNNGILSHYLV